jgi:hypothetical protein
MRLTEAQTEIAKAREQMQLDAQAFVSETADFRAKYSLDALEQRKAAIQADVTRCTQEREEAEAAHSCMVAAQQVRNTAGCRCMGYACTLARKQLPLPRICACAGLAA